MGNDLKILRLPERLRINIRNKQSESVVQLQKKLKELNLNTVCQTARCPNLGTCFDEGTATFLILGSICTRNCRFCNISYGRPEPVSKTEPLNIAEVVHELHLKHAVITSVTRDDLPDGGAHAFERTITEIKNKNPETSIEVLIPDFKNDIDALNIIFNSQISVFNHNIETIKRLYQIARAQANYEVSLNVLQSAAQVKGRKFYIKSGFMIGLGEDIQELEKLMEDLAGAGVEILTIGQYLRPSLKHLEVKKYYTDEEFLNLENSAYKKGFLKVVSGPFVRSSYKAGEILTELNKRK